MKRVYLAMIIGSLLVMAAAFGIHVLTSAEGEKVVKVGVIYVGDSGTAYTENFIRAIEEIENIYGERVSIYPKYNVPENNAQAALQQLVDVNCDIIFSTSYGYGEVCKQFAQQYPDIEFCQVTRENANTEPRLANYHNAMGRIYEGRYVSGVIAGMKLKELIDSGKISAEQAKIGYVAAFPYAEVISGYTSFFLGVRSVVPEAVMSVLYTNSWSNYNLEKQYAERLIAEGCVIISQHSDTSGVAVACEDTSQDVEVYCVSYNKSMMDVAPTTYLTGCRIDWSGYMIAAVQAEFDNRKIERSVKGDVIGNDVAAGFDEGWVDMLALNERIAAAGTADKVEKLIKDFKKGNVDVFKGDYIGVDPFNENDIYDLNRGYTENEYSSAPTFHYVLKDVITVLE